MDLTTIAIMSPGDMGHNVGRVLRESGYRVITCLAGRSERSRRLAQRGGLIDVSKLADLLEQADIVLSIMPPASALQFARQTAALFPAIEYKPYYADCNAVSPMTVKQIAFHIEQAGARFIDIGIVGPAPGKGQPPRFWVSGPHAAVLAGLDGKGIQIKPLGDEIGRASAIKMCYAALNKGTLALQTAVLMAAERLSLSAELHWELEYSQAAVYERILNSVPWLATDAERWIGEMEEIAATFAQAGVTPDFHNGAAAIYRTLAATALAEETRESADRTRSLDDSVRIFSEQLANNS